MIDKVSIDALAKLNLVDKRQVFWWQLGYEGRKILSEDEFEAGLRTVVYDCWISETRKEPASFKIWTKDFVPIMIKKVEISPGITTDCFISVKPITHDRSGNLDEAIEQLTGGLGFAPGVYESPHIRGISIEATSEFLFWHPIMACEQPNSYETYAFSIGEHKVIAHPVSPQNFYKNIIERNWPGGKRSQRKPLVLDSREMPFEVVPYYEFNPSIPNIMIYPAKVFEKGLDMPTVIRGNEFTGIPQVLGAGFAYLRNEDVESEVNFWPYAESQKKLARNSLIARLGRAKPIKFSSSL